MPLFVLRSIYRDPRANGYADANQDGDQDGDAADISLPLGDTLQITEYNDAEPLTIAVVGDMHVNSTLGLAPERFTNDDGVPVGQSPFQVKLWACWLDYWRQVQQDAAGGHVVGIINGDLVDGDHHRTPQVITSNLTDQHKMTMQVLEPARSIVSGWFCIRGTEAHAGLAGQNEELIARDLGAIPDETGRFARWYLRASFGGVKFDIAHHGSMGRLPWTAGNLLIRQAVEIELEYRRHNVEPPAFAVRSHNHRWGESGALNAAVRVLALAGWQGPTAYVQRLKPGCSPQVGGMIFRISNGMASFRAVNYSEECEWII